MDEARRKRQAKREEVKLEEQRGRTASDERKLKRKRALRKKQSRRRLIVFVVIAALLVALAFSVTSIIKLKREQHNVRDKQEQLLDEKQQLEQDLDNINDPQSIEDQAREKLKLIKPGETIYIPDEDQ